MNNYKFIEKKSNSNVLYNIYYVKSNTTYNNTKNELIKIIPSLEDFDEYDFNIDSYYEIGPKKILKLLGVLML